MTKSAISLILIVLSLATGFIAVAHAPVNSPEFPLELQVVTETPPTPATQIHVVGYGDTLGLIASRYHTTVSNLMALNGIVNPNLIYIGQEIRVPAPEQPTPLPTLTIEPTTTPVFEPTTAATLIPTTAPTATITPIPTATPSPEPAGEFTVEGSHILSPTGADFTVFGVNVNGVNWVWEREITQDVDLIQDCWGFNTVRLNSLIFTDESRYEQFQTNNDLDHIVDVFTGRRIVVMIEAHDRTGRFFEGDDLTALQAWYLDLARRYRDNPYVWFNVANEPGAHPPPDREAWLTMNRAVIETIRDQADADNVIVVDGTSWGQDAGSDGTENVQTENSALLQWTNDVEQFNDKTYGNIIFSFHVWDQWNFGAPRMANYVDRLLAQDIPVIVGEYGILNGEEDTTAAVDAMFEVLPPRGIGRIAWAWDGGDNNDLTTGTSQGGGWEIDNCYQPSNLSAFGQQIWDDTPSIIVIQ